MNTRLYDKSWRDLLALGGYPKDNIQIFSSGSNVGKSMFTGSMHPYYWNEEAKIERFKKMNDGTWRIRIETDVDEHIDWCISTFGSSNRKMTNHWRANWATIAGIKNCEQGHSYIYMDEFATMIYKLRWGDE